MSNAIPTGLQNLFPSGLFNAVASNTAVVAIVASAVRNGQTDASAIASIAQLPAFRSLINEFGGTELSGLLATATSRASPSTRAVSRIGSAVAAVTSRATSRIGSAVAPQTSRTVSGTAVAGTRTPSSTAVMGATNSASSAAPGLAGSSRSTWVLVSGALAAGVLGACFL